MPVRIERAQLRTLADGLAVAMVATIPWSTSIATIFLGLWLVVLIPTLDPQDLRDVMRHPAAWLPVALFVLAALGMLWADVEWKERFRSLGSFARLLVLPLLFAQFRRSDRANWIFLAFLASCSLMLVLSFASILGGDAIGLRFKRYGVPVRDHIAQSGEFILCAAGLFYVAMSKWSERNLLHALAALALAALFLTNVFYVAPSRTGLVTVPILLVLFAITQCRWSQMLALLAAIAILGGIVWTSSLKVQQRLIAVITEVQDSQTQNIETSAGQRLRYLMQSLDIIRASPALGHGTGSLREMFVRVTAAQGDTKVPTTNPHNQTLTIAIQLGLVGAALLFAMWLSHFSLFLRGAGLAAWIGLAIVVQNVIGSLFNNHLFDFTQGWIYMFGVGAAGAVVLGQRDAAMAPAIASGTAATRP